MGQVAWVHAEAAQVRELAPWTVCHNHSIEQIAANVSGVNHVLSLRRPALASLSTLLVRENGYVHVYSAGHADWCEAQLEDPDPGTDLDYCARVVAHRRAFVARRPAVIPIEDLRYRRWIAMNWNDLASGLLAGRARVLDYDAWQHDLAVAAGLLCMPVPKTFVLMRDPLPLLDRVQNGEEISRWLDQHREEDLECLDLWSRRASA